jgi:hypothetical protein
MVKLYLREKVSNLNLLLLKPIYQTKGVTKLLDTLQDGS